MFSFRYLPLHLNSLIRDFVEEKKPLVHIHTSSPETRKKIRRNRRHKNSRWCDCVFSSLVFYLILIMNSFFFAFSIFPDIYIFIHFFLVYAASRVFYRRLCYFVSQNTLRLPLVKFLFSLYFVCWLLYFAIKYSVFFIVMVVVVACLCH